MRGWLLVFWLLAVPVCAQIAPYIPYATGSDVDPGAVNAMVSNANKSLLAINAHFGGQVSSADYGVVCDGVTDNASAFGKFTAAAGRTGAGFIPPSLQPCMTSAALVLPANTVVWSYPGSVTIKPAAGSSAAPLLVSVANVSNVTVYGITFDGNINAVGNTNNVLQVYNASNVSFDNVTIQNTRGLGLVFSTAVVNSGVLNSIFQNVGMYWVTSGQGSDQIQGVSFCCGPSLTSSATQGAPSATLTFTSTAGVAVGDYVTNTSYIYPGTMVTAVNGTTVTLSQTTAAAAPSGTVFGFFRNSGNYVRDNYFYLTGLDAISVTSQANLDVSGNTCKNVGGTISGGVLTSPHGGACIYGAQLVGFDFTHNVSEYTGGNGVDFIFGSNGVVNGNVVRNGADAGFDTNSSRDVVWVNNICENNGQNTSGNFRAGIAFSLQTLNTLPMARLTVANNSYTDTQSTPTQQYGFRYYSSGQTATDIWLDDSNSFTGNVVSDFGGTGSAPTLSTCGTSPSVSTDATSASGQVAEGSSSTGCTITFGSAFTNAPKCIVASEAGLAFSYTVSTTAITVTNIGALSSTKLDYRCARH